MKALFLDDSYQKEKNYLGFGGFCIDESKIRILIEDILNLKSEFNIPRWVILKWSPGPKHFLRTKFTGDRQELNNKAIQLLHKHDATIICAVHDLNDCYGVRLHQWDFKRTRIWATKEQFRFISERYETPYLSIDNGLIIVDHYSDVEGETSLIREASLDFERGTKYRKFQKICMPPLTSTSRDCSPLQIADIVIGVVVSSLAKNYYGLRIFEEVAKLFLKDPRESSSTFTLTFSRAIMGFGLKLFPPNFGCAGTELFEHLDKKYKWTDKGLVSK